MIMATASGAGSPAMRLSWAVFIAAGKRALFTLSSGKASSGASGNGGDMRDAMISFKMSMVEVMITENISKGIFMK